MYTTSEEARSDLLLAGAVFLFGPLLVRLLLAPLPLGRVPVVVGLLNVLLPLAYTVLVPLLLIRYRKERLVDYGLQPSPVAAGRGAVLALPIVAGSALAALLAAALPGLPLADFALGRVSIVSMLERLATWVGLVLLAVYGTVKARDAFRGDPRYLPPAAWQVGTVVAAVAGGAGLLLVLSSLVNGEPLRFRAALLLDPLAVVVTALLVWRDLSSRQLTTRAALVTPAVLMALGTFSLSFNALALVTNVWKGAILALVGVVVGALIEARRSPYVVVGLATVTALVSYL